MGCKKLPNLFFVVAVGCQKGTVITEFQLTFNHKGQISNIPIWHKTLSYEVVANNPTALINHSSHTFRCLVYDIDYMKQLF